MAGYLTCGGCGVIWHTADAPAEPEASWSKLYYADPELMELHGTRRSGIDAIVRRLNEVCPGRGKLLDVGAGVGLLMRSARDSGWIVEGVEPAKDASERARFLSGATVHVGTLERIGLEPSSFDAITVLDTLRHVPDPIAFLKAARRLLRPNGVLLIREAYGALTRWPRRMKNALTKPNKAQQRRAFYYQCFSPRSLLYALGTVGLAGRIEPSPVFVEGDSSFDSACRRAIGAASSAVFKLSGKVVSPNLLAFGRLTIRSSE
jgi:SAM-dependent methyltransferase